MGLFDIFKKRKTFAIDIKIPHLYCITEEQYKDYVSKSCLLDIILELGETNRYQDFTLSHAAQEAIRTTFDTAFEEHWKAAIGEMSQVNEFVSIPASTYSAIMDENSKGE